MIKETKPNPEVKINKKEENIKTICESINTIKYSYKNEFSILESVSVEKRKRSQIYGVINLLIPQVTFFDFFTKDTIDLIVIALKINKILNLKEMTLDILFLAFFFYKSPFTSFLESEGVLDEKIIHTQIIRMPYIFKLRPKTFFEFIWEQTYLYLPLLFIKKTQKNKFNPTSELMQFFENLTEIALKVYKTPTICLKMLFLVLMEKTQGNFIKNFFKNEEDWYIIRFKIVKEIFFEEYPIKKYVEKPQLKYAYLNRILMNPYHIEKLKTFTKTKAYKRITIIVDRFRTTVIKAILDSKNNADIINFYDNELLDFKKFSGNRKYTL